MCRPASAARAANSSVSTVAGTREDRAPAPAAGSTPAAANSSPARHRTAPALAWATSAVTDVTITTTRLAVVAAAGVKPSR